MPEVFNACKSACVVVCLGLCVREKFKAPSKTMVQQEKERKTQSFKQQWCERKK
jgi:hypothetical protein